jgi:hypothetical protein
MSGLEYPMKTIRQLSLAVILLAIAVARAQAPQIFQEFNPWTGNISPDGIWRKNGVWVATGGNTFDPARCILTTSYPGERGEGEVTSKSEIVFARALRLFKSLEREV